MPTARACRYVCETCVRICASIYALYFDIYWGVAVCLLCAASNTQTQSNRVVEFSGFGRGTHTARATAALVEGFCGCGML